MREEYFDIWAVVKITGYDLDGFQQVFERVTDRSAQTEPPAAKP
jgi:hypothetical protein